MANIIIERFNSWAEIFPDPAEANYQYVDFLARTREDFEYSKHLRGERVEIDPETGLSVVIFERGRGESTIQRLPNGNIRMQFITGDQIRAQEITPEAGNRKHHWTYQDITSMAAAIKVSLQTVGDSNFRTWLDYLDFYLKGKPATMGWEETYLQKGVLPQRVGYRLYHAQALELAREELMNCNYLNI